jgi:uncharacterized protein YcbX
MIVGKIESLWRFPIKSFQGEKLTQLEVGKQGFIGDRAYALIDKETAKVVSAKNVRLFPNLLYCKAAYQEDPSTGKGIPPVQITLADGTTFSSDTQDVNSILSAYFRRDVTLARVDTNEKHDSFMDAFPISVITTSTLENLSRLSPETNFDVRRFRMNAIIKTPQEGFVENLWIGSALTIGESIRFLITKADARCIMTTLAQDELPKDSNVLRSLFKHNAVDIDGSGMEPCAGVYADVYGEGLVSVNDDVSLEQSL